MDWQLKPVSRKSEISGEAFAPGDHIICFVYKNAAGELHRADIREEEEEQYKVPAILLARWTRVVKERNEEEKEAQQQTINTAEELFLSLFNEEGSAEEETEKVALKQLLALLLERKRILRRLPTKNKMQQIYLHSSSKREYTVPMEDLKPEQLASIEEQLTKLIL